MASIPCPKCGSVRKSPPRAGGLLRCRDCRHQWPHPNEAKRPSLRWDEAPNPVEGGPAIRRSPIRDEES